MLIEDLYVVLKVAEFKSITAAASSLDMRTATASAAVKRVENALGMELFIRTTRKLRLSSAGEEYIPLCEQALLMLEQAKHKVRDDFDIVEGTLRIAVPSDLGRNVVSPWLDELMENYPKLKLIVNVSDSPIDFYRDAVDIALRYGSVDSTDLYGFKISTIPKLLCASREYLDKNGTPKHPEDLALHSGLFYQLYNVSHTVWEFSRGAENYKVKMSGNRATNDGDLVRRWCVAGKGIAVKSSLDMAADVMAERVIPVMPEFRPRSTELWLICPSRQLITPAVRLLRETLDRKCKGILQELVERGFVDKTMV